MWRTGTIWSFKNDAKVGRNAGPAGQAPVALAAPLNGRWETFLPCQALLRPHGSAYSHLKPPARCSMQVYGSPALDAVWCELSGVGGNPLPGVLAELRGAEVPQRVQLAASSAPKARGGKKKQ